MRIENVRTLNGPNVYHYKPVLLARVDLEELTEKESSDFPGFNGVLLELLPGLADHHCAKGSPGGFLERLEGGTYFGHVAEHVAIELMSLSGVEARYGKTLYAGRPGLYDVVIRFECEETARHCLERAFELVPMLLRGEAVDLQPIVREGRRIADRNRLGPSSAAIVAAARRRRIPVERLGSGSLFRLGYGARARVFRATIAHSTRAIGVDVACDKELTKSLLGEAMIPVPRGLVVASAAEACAALDSFGAAVVKPLDGNQGRGVTVGVSDRDAMRRAFESAREISAKVIVEEQLLGRDYRLLVVDGALAAASLRLPARVTGDGASSVSELVDAVNRNPSRGEGHSKPLTRLALDASALSCLAEQGMTPGSVPPPGRDVLLRRTANLSTGGEAVDVTSEVHPEIVAMCSRAARVVGLDLCGIDLITPDISQPLPESGAGIIEINAAPGIRMHEHPSRGRARAVGEAIIDMLYPVGSGARIPVIAITGTNGKTTTTRMIERVVSGTGRVVGMTTTDGIFIGGRRIARGDTTGYRSCRAVLADPAVEAAVLEVARGGLLRGGLAFDECDVAVLTNIQADHIGQDGIESMEDLFDVKSLVAERVRENGTVILNADDANLVSLPEHPRMRRKRRRIVYFSLFEDNPVIEKHLAENGTGYFVRNGWVIEAAGSTERPIMKESSLPATLNGQARFQVANALAAIAACRAHGLEVRKIARSLSRFENDLHNPGRLNVFRVANGHVLVDYGHNPAALSAVASLAAGWRNGRKVGCVLSLPGDRQESLSEEAARVAARGFDRIIIREDDDLRGRGRGELAEKLYAAVRRENPSIDCKIVLGGREPFAYALETMSEDEIVIFFHDEISHPLTVLKSSGAVPCPVIGAARMPPGEPLLRMVNA